MQAQRGNSNNHTVSSLGKCMSSNVTKSKETSCVSVCATICLFTFSTHVHMIKPGCNIDKPSQHAPCICALIQQPLAQESAQQDQKPPTLTVSHDAPTVSESDDSPNLPVPYLALDATTGSLSQKATDPRCTTVSIIGQQCDDKTCGEFAQCREGQLGRQTLHLKLKAGEDQERADGRHLQHRQNTER